MSKQEAIRNAARAVKSHGLTLPADLERQIDGLENPQYRVAVVGEYSVGKSTLINRVFLGDKPILSEGHGLCNTAVATDIECGSEAKMEVYDWGDKNREAEQLVETVPNPTEDDVEDATVATAEATRAELAKKRSRVRIQVPNEALRGFTVIDTPGLDDPEEELLLNTTWRVIPSADVALLVVDCRKLPESTADKPIQGRVPGRVLDLLRKKIMGESGIARLMVLVSCKPSDGFHAKQRADVLTAIKSQLSSIGRDNIPVEMYCFDPAVEDIMSDVSEIRMTIRNFLTENALPGREEKVANLLRVEIEKDLVEVAAKLKTAGASEAERAAVAAKVEAEVESFKEKAERAFERFQKDATILRENLKNDVDNNVGIVFDKFVAEVKSRSGSEKAKFIGNAAPILKSELNDKISNLGLEFKAGISELVRRYGNDMEEVRARWNVFLSEEFQVKKPFIAKVPGIVWTGLEVYLYTFFAPFGLIGAIVTRLVGKQFFTPVPAIADWIIDRQVQSGMEESKNSVCADIKAEIDKVIENSFAEIKNGMEESNKAQVETIRSVLAAEPAGAGDRAALESAKADLESVLATL